MEELAVKYFVNLFQGQQQLIDIDRLLPNLSIPKISTEQAKKMVRPYIEQEVVKALKDMHPSKAPGPDGFHVAFTNNSGT